jgi:ATP-dependent Zn protease
MQWRRLARVATFVAILASPALYVWFHRTLDHSVWTSILLTAAVIIAFRGLLDVIFRKFIPWPSLFGIDDTRIKEEDIVNRNRAWFWRRWYKRLFWLGLIGGGFFGIAYGIVSYFGIHINWGSPLTISLLIQGVYTFLTLPFLFIVNFLILFGPLMLMAVSQVRGFEPGDADWGVKLDHVRGQKEAKEEVRRVVNLWQTGEAFEKAGGKRERGLLFLGAPGTGKTMLAKAIATGFNSPIVTIPGSGFAQMFMGMDAIVVRLLARKAKKLARKWGGQCLVFIDEIDAVGMRRSALGGAYGHQPQTIHDVCFHGENGAITASGDVILQSRDWAEKLFMQRREPPRPLFPPLIQKIGGIVNQAVPGMFGGGGQTALNQLLVVMDGIDNPPFLRRVITNRVNTWLDASYIVPRRLGKVTLRLPKAKPTGNQIYFVVATNVPLQALDPALTRPGRMGRHIWFRTPTKDDRKDIYDLYLEKVDHDPVLDTPNARDELSRVTQGYSPAMIEQVCSVALTYAHHSGREQFSREDILEAMTTVEAGTAIGWDYIPEEARAIAIHEAGHACAAHVFVTSAESTRLSIKRRGFTGGHHQAAEKDERFAQWRHELFAGLVWTLGAMAAEYVFYGENTNGVGGDVASATGLASTMVGTWAMAPERPQLNGHADDPDDPDQHRDVERRIMRRFEEIGLQILRRTGTGPNDHDTSASVLGDRDKREAVAQLLGQAFFEAYNLIRANKDGVERVAEVVLERKEIYGDELVQLLDSVELKKPQVDLMKRDSWPTL